MFLGLPDPHPGPLSEVRIRGSGSVPKCHRSPTPIIEISAVKYCILEKDTPYRQV
jgi:hypothetical protein